MADPATATIRVLTWNLWWRFGDWRRRLPAIDAVLRDVQPDVCCFQEVWSTEAEDAAAWLGERNGMRHVERSYSDKPEHWQRRVDQPGVDFGNAVVSRHPMERVEARRLPGAEGRTALAVLVAAPSGVIPVVCTHLAAHPAASAERCAQVRSVADLVASLGSSAFPPVVAGDLNAEPDSDEVRLFGGNKTAPAVPGLFLIDAWRWAAAHDDPGWTWRRDNPHLPATYAFDARIDYVHVGAAGPGEQGVVTGVHLAGDDPVEGIWPSDHLAVVVDLRA